MSFDAFKVNNFGDMIDVRVGFNSQNIFEVIDGKIQNKLSLFGINELVRQSDQLCRLTIVYCSNNQVSYIFRPEDYDLFISNLFHAMEDMLITRPGGLHGLSIMEQRVAHYSIFSVKKTEVHVPIKGLQSSPKIDEVLLAGIQTSSDTDSLTSQLEELNSNTLMRNDLNFSSLLNILMNNVVEVASFFDHSIFLQIQDLLREHREDLTKILFKNIYDKNLLVVDENKPSINTESISELLSKFESKNREIDKRIAYIAGRAKQYETFLTRKEVTKNILYCCKVIQFLTICTNNTLFFKELAIHINIPKPGVTELYKSFVKAIQKLALQRKTCF